MKCIVPIFTLLIGIAVGVAYEKFESSFHGTDFIITNDVLYGDNNMVLPKGTFLNYVEDSPEGMIQANLAVALEADALDKIEHVIDKRPNVRHQYFYRGSQ